MMSGAHDTRESRLWTPMAWLDTPTGGRWARDVLLEIDAAGHWSRVDDGVTAKVAAAAGASLVHGPLLPGVINAHSHAFQRAFAGLAERRDSESDDFWSWRDRMYRVALAISPEQLKAVATQLYIEMLRGGYTQVCEFHYLHHDASGSEYADPLLMAWTLADAAAAAGIGLTLLPVVYERAGFSAPVLRHDQRRFRADAAWALDAAARINDGQTYPLVNAGVALHSLRAASEHSVQRVAQSFAGPIHIHVAEQTAEVDECLRVHGQRPVQWLAAQGLDRRWQLVHATHVTADEIDAVAASGACAVICPSTEANLGDGLTDVARWLSSGCAVAIGSDSHVTRDWREELRWLEYGQRLQRRARNVTASPSTQQAATAERLFSRVSQGAAAAAGLAQWGIRVGARADAVVAAVDGDAALLGVPALRTLDAMVFSSPSRAFGNVMVAGRWVVRDGAHAGGASAERTYVSAMRALWPEES